MWRRGLRCLGLFGVWGGPPQSLCDTSPRGELLLDFPSGGVFLIG